MKLYYSPGACSLAIHIMLREAGLPFELERVDLRAKTTASGADFTAINPKGYVPALALDDGEVLTELSAIAQYIADQAPQAQLAPPAAERDRYRLQGWLSFVSGELHKSFSPLFRPDTPEEYKSICRENISRRLDYLEQALAGKSYLMGDRYGVADAYLFVVLNWTSRHQIDLARWPSVQALFERVKARPATAEALGAEGLKT